MTVCVLYLKLSEREAVPAQRCSVSQRRVLKNNTLEEYQIVKMWFDP